MHSFTQSCNTGHNRNAQCRPSEQATTEQLSAVLVNWHQKTSLPSPHFTQSSFFPPSRQKDPSSAIWVAPHRATSLSADSEEGGRSLCPASLLGPPRQTCERARAPSRFVTSARTRRQRAQPFPKFLTLVSQGLAGMPPRTLRRGRGPSTR